MANFIESIFGAAPDYSGALSPEQMDQLKQNAALQGGIGSLVTLLGMSGPQARPVGTGQALGAALGAGFGGYQSSFDNTLKQMLTGAQLSDYQTKAAKQKQLAAAMAITDPIERIKALQAGGQYDIIKGMAESEQALRKSGMMRTPGEAEAPSPFAPYLQSSSPQVKQLAAQLEQGYKSGVIDEETAYKRIEPLAKMEESFITRQIAAGERAAKAAEGSKPTEGEKKTATLAGRLEGALGDLTQISSSAQTPEIFPSLFQKVSFIPGAEMIAGKLSSSERLRAEAAQLDALDAALTLGTGAAYTSDQLKGYAKSYFPQVGDTPEVIQDKNNRFARIVTLAREQSGAAGKSIDVARAKAKTFDLKDFKEKQGLQ